MNDALPPRGLLLVDKPAGLTSHDVVARARRALGTRKVGHAGTLDPMATGLLVLGVGSSTRLLGHLLGLGKRYEATVRFGADTVTDDAEGDTTTVATPDAIAALDEPAIRAAFAAQTGEIMQVPSTVSAIKVDGKRAYARARAGEQVELAARPITVHALEVGAVRRVPQGIRHSDGTTRDAVDVDIDVTCSSGTYIRAIARDAGAAVGTGAHLTALRRTSIGPYSVDGTDPLGDPNDEAVKLRMRGALLPAADAAAQLFPTWRLDESQARDLAHGKRVDATGVPDGAQVAAIAPSGVLAGLVEVASGRARVLVNFPTDEVLG